MAIIPSHNNQKGEHILVSHYLSKKSRHPQPGKKGGKNGKKKGEKEEGDRFIFH